MSTRKLPTHVAFKGDNGRYISARPTTGVNVLHSTSQSILGTVNYLLSASESIEGTVKNTIIPLGDDNTTVHIKSQAAKYWKRYPDDYICADADHAADDDLDTLFVVTETGTPNVIALRNKGNQKYCAYDTADTVKKLKAFAPTSTLPEAQLVVEEVQHN